MMPPRRPECCDCKAERERCGKPYPAYPRPAPYPGPRCASHDRAKKRLAKSGAHERRVRDVYGLKSGEYGKIYLVQGGKCAICRRATGATRKLSVDHDHKDGLVRGLLCRPCNDLLGHLRDDPAAGYRIAAYLVDPPAQQIGIKAVHKDFRREQG